MPKVGDIFNKILVVEVYETESLISMSNGGVLLIKNESFKNMTFLKNIKLPKAYKLCKYILNNDYILMCESYRVITLLVEKNILTIGIYGEYSEYENRSFDYEDELFTPEDIFSLYKKVW